MTHTGETPDQEATVKEKRDRYTKTLPVPLVTSEILERADLSSHLLKERDEAESRMKADSAQQKATIAEKESRIREIGEEIRQKRAYKPVDCERVYDYVRKRVCDVRLDTGEEIERRDMTYEETQQDLDFDKGGRGKGNGKRATEEPAKDPEAAKADEAAGAEEAAKKVRGKRGKKA